MRIQFNKHSKRAGAVGKKLLLVLGALFALVVVAYLVVTSGFFFKSMIAPRVGAAIGADLKVGSASISPFSRVALGSFEITAPGRPTLLKANEIRLGYNLVSILRGTILVNEVSIIRPEVVLVTEADGTSNLDPILAKLSSGGAESTQPPAAGEPLQIAISNVKLEGATIRNVVKLKGGGENVTEIRDLTITLDKLANGGVGSLSISGGVGMSEPGSGGVSESLSAKLAGKFDVGIGQQLEPQVLKGSMTMEVGQVSGKFTEYAGLAAAIQCDLSPTEIKGLVLSLTKGSQALGSVRVSGPLDAAKKEGRVLVEVNSIDRNLLNFAGLNQGMDFRDSRFSSTNQVELTQGGSFITLGGVLGGRQISILKDGKSTPELNLDIEYQTSVNLADSVAVLQQFQVNGTAGGQPLIRGELDRPMNLSWGTTVKGFRDAGLNLVLTNFNLAQWGSLVGTNLRAGSLGVDLKLLSQKDGKQVRISLGVGMRGLGMANGTNLYENLDASFGLTGTLEEMKRFDSPEFKLAMSQGGLPVVDAVGSLRHDLEKQESSGQITAQTVVNRLLGLAQVPDIAASAGTGRLNVAFSQSATAQSANGSLALEDFTGTAQGNRFEKYGAKFDFNVDMKQSLLTINKAGVALTEGFNKGGTIDLSGKFDTAKGAGQLSYKILGLNQFGVRPFVESAMAGKKLLSMTIDSDGALSLDPAGSSSIKSQLQVSNWVVDDPSGSIPKTPLAVGLKLDGGMEKQLITLREVLVQLAPTERAKNALSIVGKVDLATTNAAPGQLAIKSESFDATTYYNLFAGGPASTNAAASPPPPVAASGSATNTTSGLPVKDLVVDLDIGRFYLRDIDISNWVTKVAIKNDVVDINPLKLAINGGSIDGTIRADMRTPEPGIAAKLNVAQVPLAPILATFSEEGTSDLKGEMFLKTDISTSGQAGTPAHMGLAGAMELMLTNMVYEVAGPKMKMILIPIAAALRVPELASAPILWVAAKSTMVPGKVSLNQAAVESAAFYADVTGDIAMDTVLTNSTLALPIDLSIRRSYAERSKLLPPNTPPDAKHAKMPRFLRVEGTIGAPESKIDWSGLASFGLSALANIDGLDPKLSQGLQGVTGLLQGGGKSTNGAANPLGGVLQGVGGLLGNQGTQGTNAPATTNAPAGVGGLLQGVGGLFGKQPTEPKGTNAPPAATNAPSSNPLDLFRRRN